ncbi:MAG TPA: prepilin-type N-terminal cleavage/methylation domain-containing protein [Acidimicrobiales bacterium]|nr:prepilin-type N-terminal cleavage/methylation domain-containing protein [Acidimicrobiales bacterium]
MSFVERCRQRHLGSEGGDEGFTLIELLVVLLIIGILLAIAIPTFLSVTHGATNTAAQSNLQNALTGAKVYFTDTNQSYVGIETANGSTSDIYQIGTGLSWVSSGTSSNGPHVISADVLGTPAGSVLELAAFANGTSDCWFIIDETSNQTAAVHGAPLTAGTYFGVTKSSSTTTCLATATPTTLSSSAFPPG